MFFDGILILGTRGTKRTRQAASLAQSLAEEEATAEFDDSQAGPSRSQSTGSEKRKRNNNSVVVSEDEYDPEEPTEDPPQDNSRLFDDIKGFLYEQIETLNANLDQRIKRSQEKLAQNLSHHLSFIDEKLSQKAQKPVLKSGFNNKHWERTQRYRTFLQDAKYHLEAGCEKEAIACIDACDEACKVYQADIVLADRSEAGWELVERLGQDQKDRDIRNIERKIIEERKAKKSKNDQPNYNSKNVDGGSSGSGGQASGAKNWSPCIWCGAGNHSYKFCYIWKADVESGKAVYDTNSRKWVRVQDYGGK